MESTHLLDSGYTIMLFSIKPWLAQYFFVILQSDNYKHSEHGRIGLTLLAEMPQN